MNCWTACPLMLNCNSAFYNQITKSQQLVESLSSRQPLHGIICLQGKHLMAKNIPLFVIILYSSNVILNVTLLEMIRYLDYIHSILHEICRGCYYSFLRHKQV